MSVSTGSSIRKNTAIRAIDVVRYTDCFYRIVLVVSYKECNQEGVQDNFFTINYINLADTFVQSISQQVHLNSIGTSERRLQKLEVQPLRKTTKSQF